MTGAKSDQISSVDDNDSDSDKPESVDGKSEDNSSPDVSSYNPDGSVDKPVEKEINKNKNINKYSNMVISLKNNNVWNDACEKLLRE